MPAPYSNDLRIRVIQAMKSGKQKTADIADTFSVSTHFVRSLWRHYQKTGSVTPKQIGGYTQPKVDKKGEEHLREWLANEASLTLQQLCDRYEEHFGVTMGKSSMDRALKRANITVKKSPYDPKKDSPRIQALTEAYAEDIQTVAQGKFYFVDEMGAALNLIPLYGRAHRSERVYETKPTAKGQRVSLVGALNSSGIAAALTIEGTLNGNVFLYFIEQCLCPLLKAGDYVVLDNATAHKVEGVREHIEAKGATLVYLPPYSPELNAIEFAWNKIKHYLRKQRARTTKHLHKAYFKALRLITVENARKFIEHAIKALPRWEM